MFEKWDTAQDRLICNVASTFVFVKTLFSQMLLLLVISDWRCVYKPLRQDWKNATPSKIKSWKSPTPILIPYCITQHKVRKLYIKPKGVLYLIKTNKENKNKNINTLLYHLITLVKINLNWLATITRNQKKSPQPSPTPHKQIYR